MHQISNGVKSLPEARRIRFAAVGISMLLLGVVAFLDYQTGRDVSFTLLYLLPICAAAWFVGRAFGIAVCLIAAICGLVIGAIGEPMLAVTLWNAGMRFGVYLCFSTLLHYLKTHSA